MLTRLAKRAAPDAGRRGRLARGRGRARPGHATWPGWAGWPVEPRRRRVAQHPLAISSTIDVGGDRRPRGIVGAQPHATVSAWARSCRNGSCRTSGSRRSSRPATSGSENAPDPRTAFRRGRSDPSDLATDAATRALEAASIAPRQLDLLICATLTGDTPIHSHRRMGATQAGDRGARVRCDAACARLLLRVVVATPSSSPARPRRCW